MLPESPFRKSPEGYMSEGRELKVLLRGVGIGDPSGGVTVISTGGTTMTSFLATLFRCFGTRYPLRAFIFIISIDSGMYIGKE
jgi:hypothetical protein